MTVTATSTLDNTKVATATVNLAVAVTIAPTTASLYSSETQQFTSTVAGGGGVTWAINPTNAGSISTSGFYSAPVSISTTQSVTVTVTSVSDPTKSATAAVTLNPPASPGILQQPQDATAVVGRTATFAVVASGGALSYQWQSLPPGGAFGNIGGANSSSYTTPAVTLANNGTQYRVLISNSLGNITSNVATLTAAQSLNFVTSATPGGLQNDFTGWVGMSVTIGADPVVVNSLGRIVAPGNTIAHTLKIVDGSTLLDVPGGSVSVPTAGGAVGAFAYASLTSPLTLNANATYYILSQETKNGEFFYDTTTAAQTTTAGVLNGPVYGTPYVAVTAPGHMYGPLDFSYTAPFAVAVSHVRQPVRHRDTAVHRYGCQQFEYKRDVDPQSSWRRLDQRQWFVHGAISDYLESDRHCKGCKRGESQQVRHRQRDPESSVRADDHATAGEHDRHCWTDGNL